MAEEVFDPWVAISIAVAFLAGLLALLAYFWLRTMARESGLGSKSGEITGSERLEYYERQLIDLKIRLDAVEMVRGEAAKAGDGSGDEAVSRLAAALSELVSREPAAAAAEEGVAAEELHAEGRGEGLAGGGGGTVPKTEFRAYPNPVDYVLHLITNDIITSRDIQVTMGKSREHTSRLLKKMYEDGYLQRDEDTRPYSYSVTQKGLERLRQGGAGD
ncbi:MAG: winged helix DNA-binding protein [Thaumarchaeota archaeon]|nr:winged helix DNA-binding protein [Nitrososphaerota archaeon]